MTVATVAIPDGFRQNAKGDLVSEANISDYEIARDDLVEELYRSAESLSKSLKSFKAVTVGAIDAFVALSAERWNVQLGGTKGNITLTSFDGKFQIKVQKADEEKLNEGVLAAQKLLNECLEEWEAGASEYTIKALNHAFRRDKDGNLSRSRLLELKSWKIDHPTWLKAMKVIDESLQVIGVRAYYRFYVRNDETKNYELLPMDFSGV